MCWSKYVLYGPRQENWQNSEGSDEMLHNYGITENFHMGRCIVGNLVLLQCMSGAVQSVTCLATDTCLTADPWVASLIPAGYHTFVEIDHEIISTVILLPSADLFKKGCCQLQAKVCAQITG